MLLTTKVSLLESVPEIMLAHFCQCSTSFCHGVHICTEHTLMWHKTTHPSLLCRALPWNIGKFFAGNLLPSLTTIVIEAFRKFCGLGKCLKCLHGLFYDFWGVFVTSCLRSGDHTLGSTYTIGFGLQKYTPLLLCIETLLKSLCWDL